jgi:hypothetical protein
MSQTTQPPKITVRNKKPGSLSVGANTEVLIDGKPLPYVSFIKIEVGAKKMAKVMIEMIGELDIQLDTIPHIKVLPEKSGPQHELGHMAPTKVNLKCSNCSCDLKIAQDGMTQCMNNCKGK